MTKTMSSQEARQLVRAAGLRCTPCRLAVVQHLAACGSPLSHAELSEILVPEGYDKTTIYRSLVELTEVNLLNRFDLGDHVWRFEWNSPQDEESFHPHFLCVQCGEVTCLDDFEIVLKSSAGAPSPGAITEALLKGRCQKCG